MTDLRIRLLALAGGGVTLVDEEDDVRGMVVLDGCSRRVGEVDDIVVDDRERRARLLVVASGGVLGLGTHRHLVPVEAVARVSDDHVRLHRSDVETPNDEEHGCTPLEATDYASVYLRYGCTPFWDPAHTTAYFHDRRF